jgi:hypothetical protein
VTSITLRRSATDLAVKLKFASGLPGVPGEASDLQEGSVTTLDANADASFSITGTPPNQILNLSLPRGMTGPVGEGEGGLFFLSRAALQGATIASDVFAVRTAGFANPGDGGDGLYYRLGSAPALTTNKGYAQSANGVWFQLVIEGDEYHVEQFGGQGNYVNSGSRGTDNYQPVLDYTAFSITNADTNFPSFKLRPALRFNAKNYWFSAGFDIATQSHFRGPVSGSSGIGAQVNCRLIFPTATNCFVFNGHGTGPGQTATTGNPDFDGAAGSSLTGLGIFQEQLGVFGAAPTAHGVHMRTVVHIRDCVFDRIAGDAIHVQAGGGVGGGIANRFLIDNVEVHECHGHGLFVWGNDSNAGNITRFYTHECGKCGICEISGLGNYYGHCEIDGYGNEGVHHLGVLYQLNSDNPTLGVAPASEPNNWGVIGAGSVSAMFPAWDAAKQYTVDDLRLPIYSYGSSNTSLFYGFYAEFGGVASHIVGNQMILGGNLATTNSDGFLGHQNGGLQSSVGFLGRKNFKEQHPGYALHGAYMSAHLGSDISSGGIETNENMDLLLFQREIDERTYLRYNSQNNIACQWSGNKTIWGWTGIISTSSIGPRIFFASDIALANPLDGNEFRLLGMRNSSPNAAGFYSVGDRFFGPDGVNWRCSVQGAKEDATWVSGMSQNRGGIIKTPANRYYRQISAFATSTTEPTHTSGVAVVDGISWLYLTSAAAVFVPVQDLTKQTSAYTTSNVATDRSFDANATTLDEVADVLGTLIADLKLAGVLT